MLYCGNCGKTVENMRKTYRMFVNVREACSLSTQPTDLSTPISFSKFFPSTHKFSKSFAPLDTSPLYPL